MPRARITPTLRKKKNLGEDVEAYREAKQTRAVDSRVCVRSHAYRTVLFARFALYFALLTALCPCGWSAEACVLYVSRAERSAEACVIYVSLAERSVEACVFYVSRAERCEAFHLLCSHVVLYTVSLAELCNSHASPRHVA